MALAEKPYLQRKLDPFRDAYFTWFPGYSGLPLVTVVEKLENAIREDQRLYDTDPRSRNSLNAKWTFLGGAKWSETPPASLRERAVPYLLACDIYEKLLTKEEYFERVAAQHVVYQFNAATKRPMLNIDEVWYVPMRNHPWRMVVAGLAVTVALAFLAFLIHPMIGITVGLGLISVQWWMWSIVRVSTSVDPYTIYPEMIDSDPLGMDMVNDRWQREVAVRELKAAYNRFETARKRAGV